MSIKPASARIEEILDGTQPKVMAIINTAPDSFSPIGRCEGIDAAIAYGINVVAQGADILDIGGEPTNPQLNPVTATDVELQRVVPVVRALSQEVSVPISVDTSKPTVMEAVLAAGAHMINDVRALREPGALAFIAEAKVPVCLMHMRYPYGVPDTNDDNIAINNKKNIVTEVKGFLQARIDACLAA